jgi:protocatechuate 4,5-dioxygenase, beta chain
MAQIVGSVFTSHVPLIGKAIAKGLQQEPYWKPFFDGYRAVHEWLEQVRPDAAVVVYNDHGLNFFLDKMPTFAVGAAEQYNNADEGWGLGAFPSTPGDPQLSWHLIESLVADEFDLTTCQEMRVDHAFVLPLNLLWPDAAKRNIKTVPISINAVQHPLPSAARCFKLGQAIGRAIESYDADMKVVVIGSGGLSHQLDGERAGHINKEFDLLCMNKLVSDPQALTRYTNRELVELAGSQGVELLMWLAARGALTGTVNQVHSQYYLPISNTATGILVLENALSSPPFPGERRSTLRTSDS